MSLKNTYAQQARYLDSMTATFADHLQRIVIEAQGHLLARLQKDLSITDGRLDDTPANLRLLRKFDDLFMEEMERAGYQRLIDAFVGQFPEGLKFVQEIIYDINQTLKTTLVPTKITGDTKAMLDSFQLNEIGISAR